MRATFIFGSQFNNVVLPLIDNARHDIRIIIFDWRFNTPDAKPSIKLFNSAIVSARNRGVTVKAIVNNELIKQRLLNLGILARCFKSDRLLHTKMLLIDNKYAIIGSHNYTQSAFSSNYELSVLSDVEDSHEILERYFDNLWSY